MRIKRAKGVKCRRRRRNSILVRLTIILILNTSTAQSMINRSQEGEDFINYSSIDKFCVWKNPAGIQTQSIPIGTSNSFFFVPRALPNTTGGIHLHAANKAGGKIV